MSPVEIKNGEEVKRKIQRDINPGSDLKHNYGQPKRAPYATRDSSTAKFLTNCAAEHSDSLKCIERNYDNRGACQPFFDAYKECRTVENEKRKEKNSQSSGGGSSWFW